MVSNTNLEIITPGEILKEEFMAPMNISANALSRALNVPPNRITEILQNRRSITADTALRLGRYFNMKPNFWLNLQMQYDLKIAQRSVGNIIEIQVHARASA